LHCRKLRAIQGDIPDRSRGRRGRRLTGAHFRRTERTEMIVRPRFSRRAIAIAAVLFGSVSVVIGAHAALNMRSLTTTKPTSINQETNAHPARLALVIGNSRYPDADTPSTQSINDARALSSSLRRSGFDVDMVEDASKDDLVRAVSRLKSKITHDSVVMLFFGGYAAQSGRESYMLPVDAMIWKESDVRQSGVSIESVLDMMKEQGARAKLVVVDASRRNPYERRFRSYSHGLAPISAPDNALVLSSNTPGRVAEDGNGEHSVLVGELLKNLDAQASAESIFNKTRIAISSTSEDGQDPTISSSLSEDVQLGAAGG